jgi:dTDP-4-dehydrorhamnose 3,5-epimerase-like enzyme
MIIELVELKSHQNPRGSLVAIESNKNIPFDIERVYYIYDVPSEARRGYHAHKELKQLAICLHGNCEFLLDDGKKRVTYKLDSPTKALYIKGLIWREMFNFSKDCVLIVLADRQYDPNDYIWDYEEFLENAK